MDNHSGDIPSIHVLGVRVHMLQIAGTLEIMESWIEERDKCRCVVATGMHGVMEARRDPQFKNIVNSADLFVPDGMSLVWVARRRGFPLRRRVSGPDLMWEFLKLAETKGYSSYFYGDTTQTLKALSTRLKESLPNLQIAGIHSPPFRELTMEERDLEIQNINSSGADVVWVGLGLPKQERWIFDRLNELEVPIAVGVGAAFKFLSGHVQRAPGWMGNSGLEWLWRFGQEPRRTWRRVMIDGPKFIGHVVLELSGIKKYD